MRLCRFLHDGQDGVEGWLGVGGQRRALRRVPAKIEEQRWVVTRHVARRAKADVRVEAGSLVLWGEVWGEVEGFPHRAA